MGDVREMTHRKKTHGNSFETVVTLLMVGLMIWGVFYFKTFCKHRDDFFNQVYQTLYEKGEINVFELKQLAADTNYKLQMDEFVVGTVKEITFPKSDYANLTINTPAKERLFEEVSGSEIHLVYRDYQIAEQTKISNHAMYVFDMEVEDLTALEGSKVFIQIRRSLRSNITDLLQIFIVVEELE